MTLQEFIQRQGLAADVQPADANPNMADMPSGSRHWLVTIKRGADASMIVPFSQGPAHTEPPALEDVLGCLADDAAGWDEARSFDEWADELGYFPMESSEDYQRAWRTYEAVQAQSEALEELLGHEAMQMLLYDTERL